MTLTASSEFVSFLDYQKYLKYDHHLDNRYDALINIGTKRKNIEACFLLNLLKMVTIGLIVQNDNFIKEVLTNIKWTSS